MLGGLFVFDVIFVGGGVDVVLFVVLFVVCIIVNVVILEIEVLLIILYVVCGGSLIWIGL